MDAKTKSAVAKMRGREPVDNAVASPESGYHGEAGESLKGKAYELYHRIMDGLPKRVGV